MSGFPKFDQRPPDLLQRLLDESQQAGKVNQSVLLWTKAVFAVAFITGVLTLVLVLR